jgi:hypothetical protein
MKAISLWQPWASAIAVGAKRYETRGWEATADGRRFMGWLAIHASKRTKYPKEEGGEPLQDTYEDLLMQSTPSFNLFVEAGQVRWETLPLGAVVAVAWLKTCHGTENLQVTDEERMWGNYGPGRFAWEFTEVWRLNTPLPVRGEQKLFGVQMPDRWQDQAVKVY